MFLHLYFRNWKNRDISVSIKPEHLRFSTLMWYFSCVNCIFFQEASNSVSPQGPASGIIECLSTLFTHISSSGVLSAVIGHLSQPIGDLYQESIKKTCAKLFNNNFMQKVSTFTCKCIFSSVNHYAIIVDQSLSRLFVWRVVHKFY